MNKIKQYRPPENIAYCFKSKSQNILSHYSQWFIRLHFTSLLTLDEHITKIYSQVIQACFILLEESSVTVTK